jgi:hypothetical protein
MFSRRIVSIAVPALLFAAAAMSSAQTPKGKAASKDAPKAASAPSLGAARGTVVKVDKESVTVRPRGADGRFEKELTLQLTGTSRVTQLSFQTRGGKSVAVQQDGDAKSLTADDSVAIIYADGPSGMILLSAVVQSK